MDHELDELKREFLSEAQEKVREIQSRLDDLNSESLERLIYLTHQLKGSGGSYGFQRISDDAAELEKAVERMVERQTDGLGQKIRQHAVNLRAEIERCSREFSATAR